MKRGDHVETPRGPAIVAVVWAGPCDYRPCTNEHCVEVDLTGGRYKLRSAFDMSELVAA